MEDRWARLEEIVRRVVREEFATLQQKKKAKLELVNGRWAGVTEEQMTAWSEAFPGVDINDELKKMAAWIVSNPMMAPKSQLGRFVNTWLTKTQNQKSLRSIPAKQEDLPGAGRKLCSYCVKVASGAPNGIWACKDHFDDAMDQKPRKHMLGVVPKPVAGAD